MKPKHTPGPWLVYGPDSEGQILVTTKPNVAGAQTVCDCEMAEFGKEQEIANAQLIAAAPKLLVVLEDVRRFLASPPYDPQGHHEGGLLLNVVDAIAKARGES